MDKSQHESRDDNPPLDEAEVSMEQQVIQDPGLRSSTTTLNTRCIHQRLIDDVLTRSGKRTGQVRCLECGTIFDDPYQGTK